MLVLSGQSRSVATSYGEGHHHWLRATVQFMCDEFLVAVPAGVKMCSCQLTLMLPVISGWMEQKKSKSPASVKVNSKVSP